MKPVKYTIISLLLLMMVSAVPSMAETNQFFFTALVAPPVSMSARGGTGNVVYLRWGSLLDEVPLSVQSYRLLRQVDVDPPVVLTEINTGFTASSGEITSLYQGAENDRRRAEIISWLDKLAQNPPDHLNPKPAPSRVTSANFNSVLAARVQENGFWAKIASRHDINVARARGLAYIDSSPPAGDLKYTLFAVNGQGAEATLKKLGEAIVITANPKIIPPAKDLKLVENFGRCDAPESGKQHGVVALNWSHGGNSEAEQYAISLLVSGYDIYRAKGSFTLPGTSLRDAAFAGSFDHSTGAPIITGLERVNDAPVMISGEAALEAGGDSGYAQFMETLPELEDKGFHPGDLVTYFVVARDLTGNYGQEARIEFRIPDYRRPPPPWDVATYEEYNVDDYPPTSYLKLRWSDINLQNYIKDFGETKIFCNQNEAQQTGIIQYVHEGESCSEGPVFELNLNIDSYLLYRFESVEEARRFTDSDGDGYADLDERATDGPGTACDSAQHPTATPNYLVGVGPTDPAAPAAGLTFQRDRLDDGRKMVVIDDPLPATEANQGNVYWYMLAAKSVNGRISPLSSPVRGFFPDRRVPDRPRGALKVFDCPVDYDRTEEGLGKYKPPLFPALGSILAAASDETGMAASYHMQCKDGLSNIISEFILPLEDKNGDGQATGEADQGQCEAFLAQCTAAVQFEGVYITPGGYPLAKRVLPGSPTACSELYSGLTRDDLLLYQEPEGMICEERTMVADDPPPKRIKFVFDTPTSDCVNIYRDIGGEQRLVRTYCPDTVLADCSVIEDTTGKKIADCFIEHTPGMPGTDACYTISVSNKNAIESPTLQLPCLREPSDDVAPPQLSRLTIISDNDKATVRIHLPEQRLTGVVLEWSAKKGVEGDTQKTTFIPAGKVPAADGTLEATLELTAQQSGSNWTEQWCVRARGAGFARKGQTERAMSDWTQIVCAERLPSGVARTPYLGWPAVTMPPEGEPLVALYLKADGIPIVNISDDIPWSTCTAGPSENVSPIPFNKICDPALESCLSDSLPEMTCGPNYCETIRGMLQMDSFGFVVYRQFSRMARDDDPLIDSDNAPGEGSEFIQVSPLIDSMYCVDDYLDGIFQNSSFDDPFIGLVMFRVDVADPAGGDPIYADRLRGVFTDRTPHFVDPENGSWYRYQFVYFDTYGEAVSYRTSNWIEVK